MAKKKNDAENSDETAPEIPEIGTDGNVTEPKKRRGRPPGSKNKAKRTNVEGIAVDALPDEMVQQVALMPITIPASILARTKGVAIIVNPQFAAALPIVFKEWLKSIGFTLTPGWALLAMYTAMLGTAEFRKLDIPKKPAENVNGPLQEASVRTGDNAAPESATAASA